MQIEAVRTYHIAKPLRRELVNSLFVIDRIEHILVEVDAGGFTGVGFVYSVRRDHALALKQMVDGYARMLSGKDASLIRARWDDAQAVLGGVGQTGMPVIAWAAFDTALWDLMAKRAALPLYKLLGGARGEVPVYASGGWLIPQDELVAEAVAYKNEGYCCYKMKVGCPDYREDLRRVEAVRAALGDAVEVMVDANQGWSVKTALLAAPELIRLGVRSLEEPVDFQDYHGQAELAARLPIRIVAGESAFGLAGHFELMSRRCVDILNPDLQRCGGVSGFMQVCALANAFRVPVSSHVFTEASAHLMAAAPTALHAEYIPDWWRGVFTAPPAIADGKLLLGNAPGLGVAFDHAFLEEHAV